MELIAVFAFALGLVIFARLVIQKGTERAQTEEDARVSRILGEQAADDYLNAPQEKDSKKKVGRASVDNLANRIGRSKTLQAEEGQSFIAELDRKLVLAGIRDRYTPEQALAWAVMVWSFGVILPVVLAVLGVLPIWLIILPVIFFAFYPYLKLRQKISARQDNIKNEVPFFIQQLYMAMSTGMATIDEAIVRVARNSEEDPYDSVLAREFAQAHTEYRVGGRSMEDAIHDVGLRTGVPSVKNLCDALVQGIVTGSELETILREYSDQAREMWRQDMREFMNKKEPLVTMGLVITMFGGFLLVACPMVYSLLQTLSAF